MRISKMFWYSLLLTSCTFLVVKAANAEQNWQAQLEVAQQMLEQKRYQEAFVEYKKHALNGNGLAQFTIALFYQNGWSRQQNQQIACHWYEKAAHNHIPQAQLLFGDCYLKGNYKQAPQRSVYWYEKAMQSGMPNAACLLGQLYLRGHYVEKNTKLAIELCRQSAEQGDVNAQLILARWFFNGKQVEQNLSNAFYWLQKGSLSPNHFQAEAAFYLAHYYEQGLGVDVDLSTARYWYEFASSKGYHHAYLPTAALYWLMISEQSSEGPSVLAKAYMWSKAAYEVNPKLSTPLLEKIVIRMPATWLAPLNEKIDAHFAKYPLVN